MDSPRNERFEVNLAYLRGTPEDKQYGSAREAHAGIYLGSIVAPSSVLEPLLHENFLHIDGSMGVTPKNVTVRNVSVIQGRDEFVYRFRPFVNDLAGPDGPATGFWLPEEAYAPIEAQLIGQLPAGVQLGKLVAAALVEFPYRLRTEAGTPPFEIPPHMRNAIRGDEAYMNMPIHAEGNEQQPERDRHIVRVLQAIYADEEGRITARVGLSWNDLRGVPFEIHREMSAVRQGETYDSTPAETIVQRLTQQAKRTA